MVNRPRTLEPIPMDYGVQMIQFISRPLIRWYRVNSPAAVRHLLLHLEEITDCMITVAAFGSHRGEFLLWCQTDRALIRLEQRERSTAVDHHSLAAADTRVVYFQNEDGSEFSVHYHETVSREQGLAALWFWLSEHRQTPELRWLESD